MEKRLSKDDKASKRVTEEKISTVANKKRIIDLTKN